MPNSRTSDAESTPTESGAQEDTRETKHPTFAVSTDEPGKKLSDQVIDQYLQLVARQLLKPEETTPGPGASAGQLQWGKTRAFVWSTQFWHMLSGGGKNDPGVYNYNYGNVRKWTTRAGLDVFELDLLVVPLGHGGHWSLGVVDFRKKELLHFCSLRGEGERHLWFEYIKKYLVDEWKDKKEDAEQPPFSFETGWKREVGPNEHAPDIKPDFGVPRQNNFVDCGVFAIVFAEQVLEQHAEDPEKRPFMLLEATPEKEGAGGGVQHDNCEDGSKECV
eukprot:g9164.t1